MQLLDKDTVKQNLTMTMAIEAIEDLLKIQTTHPDWVKTPERLVIPTFDFNQNDKSNNPTSSVGSHLSMPCVMYDGEDEYAVVKLVSICPDNPKRNLPTTVATVTVSDNATGDTLVFMDGVYITQVRTAALSGIATKHLALQDSDTVAVIGTGGMAYEQLNAVLTVRPLIKNVHLWNRTGDTAHTFKAQFEIDYPKWDVTIQVFDTIADAIKDADIINLATRSHDGLFESEQIKPHAHINAVGAYQPKMKEVSNSIIDKSAAVFIDDMTGGRHEAGDLIQAHNASDYDWTWDDLTGSLADLVSGKVDSKNLSAYKQAISVFKSVGAASFDAAVALQIAKLATQKPLGQTVNL